MHNAKAGGEIGANGAFYKGGQFVADDKDWVKGHRESFSALDREAYLLGLDIHAAKVAAGLAASKWESFIWSDESQYVGSVGDRMEMTLKLTDLFYFDAQSFSGYGMTRMAVYKFEDEDHNRFVWITSAGVDMEKGDTRTVKFAVKGHDDSRGSRETKISRVKIAA